MPDGTSFIYENKERSTAERAGAAETAVASPADNASLNERSVTETAGATETAVTSPTDNTSLVISIPQNAENSNNNILGDVESFERGQENTSSTASGPR